MALLPCVLAGCLDNPTFEVDKTALEMPRGTSSDVVVSLDGEPLTDLYGVVWQVDDPSIVTVTPAWDGKRLRIGGALEGETIVRVNSYGQTIEIPARVGPPAVVYIWIEPSIVSTKIGEQVPVRATGLDTMYQLRDLSHASTWTVRDETVAHLEMPGMMLQAMNLGQTTLHATYGQLATITDITIAQ